MFENMLDHPNITICTEVDYRDVMKEVHYDQMIYTGPIDEFFNCRYGKLPYRSLEFRHETYKTEIYQQAAVVNYPNEHSYTRVSEFKEIAGTCR